MSIYSATSTTRGVPRRLQRQKESLVGWWSSTLASKRLESGTKAQGSRANLAVPKRQEEGRSRLSSRGGDRHDLVDCNACD